MALLLLSAFLLSGLLLVALREARVQREQRRLRTVAETAAAVALGELSAAAGPDVGFTYVDVGGEVVLGRREQRARMGQGGVTDFGDTVSIQVEDLSQGSDEQAGWQAAVRATTWAKSRLGRQALAAGDVTSMLSPAAALALDVGEPEWFRLATDTKAPAGTVWWGRGLLTHPIVGGWKDDWSDRSVLAASVGPAVAARLASGDPVFSADPAKGLAPSSVVSPPFALHHAVVPVDLRLSLGLFNSRSDGRHRLRFHASGRWWNPSAAPLLADADHNLYLVEVEGAPEVEVTNQETGSSFAAFLDDCPQEDFGIFSQGLREQGLWFWAGVADPRTYGMARRGLLPGEVYAFLSPDPATQPQGLSRILTRMTWRMDDQPRSPSWTRPSPQVFRPTDRITIHVRFRGPVTLRLRPANGPAAQGVAIRDYPSAPQVVLANVPFPDFLIETTGADYSRADSSSYVIGERRACLRVSLRERSAAEWLAGMRSGQLLRTSWDLSKPEDAAEWEVANPLLAVLEESDWPRDPQACVLWDRWVNTHAGDAVGAFARFPVRDIPGGPLVDVAAVQVFLPEDEQTWSVWLDRAFASAPPSPATPGAVSDNPRLVVLNPAATDAAARLGVAGAFNVNSRDVAAWEHFLKSSRGPWVADVGSPVAADALAGPWLAILPYGAQLAPYGVSVPVGLNDARLGALAPAALTELVGQQSIRELSSEGWHRWAEAIVANQPTHGWPYPSLEAMARSGLVAQSLEDAGVNRCLGLDGADGPAAIHAKHFWRTYAPLLTVRGDTFRIVSRASAAVGGGSVEVEWIVQRVAETQAVPALGRKFRIIRARVR